MTQHTITTVFGLAPRAGSRDFRAVETEGPLTTPSVQVKPWKSKLKRVAIQAALALAALGAAYGVGRLQTAQKIDAAEKQTEQVRQAELAAQRALLEERNATKKLEARRQLSLALVALDRRNFGIAQEELAEAARLLAGHSSGELEAVRAGIAATRLVATEDLETQRGKILDFVRRFDGAVPEIKPE